MTRDEQQALNDQHASHPEVGDYWEDHFVGVLIVVAVTHGVVVFFDERIDVGTTHWQFNEQEPKSLTIEQFDKKLRYNSPGLDGKTWADVHPGMSIV